MSLPRKIVVNSLSGLRPEFASMVEGWIGEGAVFVGIVGVDAAKLEDVADEVAVGDGSDPYFLLTTSHPDESLSEAIAFAESLTGEYAGPVRVVEF